MTTEDAFLADMRENPDDDAPRLIFADWLEDNGDPDRAEFIRVQIAAARLPRSQSAEPTARALALLERHWDKWTAPLWKILGNVVELSSPILRFQRGFINELTLDTELFLTHASALFEMAPIGRLRLMQAGGHGVALSACEPLGRLRELEFVDYFREPLTAADMVPLSISPYLGKLRALRLQRNNLGDAGAEILSRAVWLSNLMALDLTDNGLSEQGAQALANTKRGFRPFWLSLSHNSLEDSGMIVVAVSSILNEAHWLDLSACNLGLPSLCGLAMADLGKLRHLDLSRNAFCDNCARRLATAPWLHGLTRLVLRNNPITRAGLAILARNAPGAYLDHS